MLVKIIFIFLGLMVLIALIGRALFPSALPRIMRKSDAARRCRACGRPQIGTRPCDCGGTAK